MKPEILLVESMMPQIESRLDAAYTVHRLSDPAQRASIDAALPRIGAAVTGGGTGISSDWIDRLPALGLVAVNGVGTDRIDLAHAAARGVAVATTLGALSDDVADLGMALLLAVSRRLVEGDLLVRSGGWQAGASLPLGRSLRGRKLGIFGLGSIGRALGERAEAFGMAVRFCSRSSGHPHWPAHPDIMALASDSDVLALCAAATPETRRVVDAPVLGVLGPDGVLINIARGSLVDEPALIAALRDGTIKGAGLDVFDNEPRISPEFLDLPGTVLMPHQASATLETRLRMGEIVLDNLAAHFAGRAAPTRVN